MKRLHFLWAALIILSTAYTSPLKPLTQSPILHTVPPRESNIASNSPAKRSLVNQLPSDDSLEYVQKSKRKSSLSKVSIRNDYHQVRKRSTDQNVNKLTTDDCANEETFYSISGTFEVYKLTASAGVGWDENEKITFTCRLSYNVVWDCEKNNLIQPTIENTLLAINGVVQVEGDRLSSRYDSERKYFDVTLHYESHANANLSCINILTDKATLVSQELKIEKVDELYEVDITPSTTTIKVGSSYTLTCLLRTHRAIRYIRWSRRMDGGGRETEINCDQEEFSCSNSTELAMSTLIVTTQETEEYKEERYFYHCRAVSSDHSNQPKAEARVTVLAIDRTWIAVLGALGGVVFGGTFFVVILLTLIRWRQKRKSARVGSLSTFYILHSTFYILHSTFYILHSTFYILHSTFYILHSTFYIIHSNFYDIIDWGVPMGIIFIFGQDSTLMQLKYIYNHY